MGRAALAAMVLSEKSGTELNLKRRDMGIDLCRRPRAPVMIDQRPFAGASFAKLAIEAAGRIAPAEIMYRQHRLRVTSPAFMYVTVEERKFLLSTGARECAGDRFGGAKCADLQVQASRKAIPKKAEVVFVHY